MVHTFLCKSKHVTLISTSQPASRDQGLERVEALLRKALQIRESALGSDNRLALKTKVSLAGILIIRVSGTSGAPHA